MKDNKKHGVFWFFKTLLTIALVIYTCVRCCMIVSDKHHANAADGPGDHPHSTHAVTLSPAQTLALFGTQIQGLLYPTQNGTPVSITFDYAFPLNSIGDMDSGGGFDTDAVLQNIWSLDSNRQTEAAYLGESNGLVYVASSSQWGGVDTSPYGASQTVQLHCPFSINLSDITGIRQSVLYSTASGSLPYWEFNQVGNVMTVLSDPNYTTSALLSNAARNGIRRATYIPMPTYPYYSANGTVDESSIQYFTMFYNSYQTDDPFSIRGFTIDCYNVTNGSSGTDLWLIVTCPTLYNYNPPPVTTVATTRPAETIPVATYPVETMPPAYTDTPQNILNQNLITNNYQLNLIIGQLNLIYNQLKINGELSAKLAAALEADNNPGLQFPVNTDIRQYMSDVMYQTGTEFVYSPEDLQTYSRAIPWLSSMFGGQTWFVPFAFLGTIGLIMIVFSYLVFRR